MMDDDKDSVYSSDDDDVEDIELLSVTAPSSQIENINDEEVIKNICKEMLYIATTIIELTYKFFLLNIIKYKTIPKKFNERKNKIINSINDLKYIQQHITGKDKKAILNSIFCSYYKIKPEIINQEENIILKFLQKAKTIDKRYDNITYIPKLEITSEELFINLLFYKQIPEKAPKTFLINDLKNVLIEYVFPGCRNPILIIFKELLNISEEPTIQVSTTYIFMLILVKIFGILTFEHEKHCANNSFRVDLYVKELKLYIECDENHEKYDISIEQLRKTFFERPETSAPAAKYKIYSKKIK